MKFSDLASVAALTLLVTGTAYAADVNVATGHDWTGFYIGANAGAAWGNSEVESTILRKDGSPRFDGDLDNHISDDGAVFTGGGLVGYNWQHETLVLGLEADINYADFGGSDNNARPQLERVYSASLSWDANWFGTVRGRLGFAADDFLFYGTGGLAYGGIDADGEYDDGENIREEGSTDGVQWGWTIGAGAEYSITDNLTLGAEYLYVDLGSTDFDYENVGTIISSNTGNAEVDYQFSVARATVKYSF